MREKAPRIVEYVYSIPWLRCLCLSMNMTIYLSIGAISLMFLEGPQEQEMKHELQQLKDLFIRKNPCTSTEDLEAMLAVVVRAANRGVSAAQDAANESNWSFGQSMFFSSTIITTIGYGHVTPLTKSGKLFCMAYTFFGIPLTLVLLSAVVERLLVPATALLRSLNASLGHLYKPFTIRMMHLSIMVSFLAVVGMGLPAAVFAALEPEWDYLDAFYYCFISLTTIGLGDYIPGDSPGQQYRPLYKVATIFYLFIGLIFVMVTMAVFYDIPQLSCGSFFNRLKPDNDPEKMRLSGNGEKAPGYGIRGLGTRDDFNHRDQRHSVVHIKPHLDDSPSPEDTTPVHAKDIRGLNLGENK